MSAYHDKSQGVTFVYTDIYKLYKKAKDSKLDSPLVFDKQKEDVKTVRNFTVPMGVKEAEAKSKKIGSLVELKKNIDSLANAHEKLRFLLQELETLTKKN